HSGSDVARKILWPTHGKKYTFIPVLRKTPKHNNHYHLPIQSSLKFLKNRHLHHLNILSSKIDLRNPAENNLRKNRKFLRLMLVLREFRFELASLGSWHSTAELRPR